MVLIVPADPFDPRQPDEHFAPEAEAAGLLGIPVISFDDQSPGSARALRVPAGADLQDAVYRGWILDADGYAALADAVNARGGSLRSSLEQYLSAHQLPGWYRYFSDLTSETAWADADDFGALEQALSWFGNAAVVIKDFVKSEKHYWQEACWIPDASDFDQAFKVIDRFKQLRGPSLTGGIVFRRFEQYVGAEARLWWLDGRLVLVSAHPDTPDEIPTPTIPDGLEAAVAALGSPFVTVDLACRADGAWRVIEVGDGQVSDRPASLAAAKLVGQVMDADRRLG